VAHSAFIAGGGSELDFHISVFVRTPLDYSLTVVFNTMMMNAESVRLQVLKVTGVKTAVSWHVAPCSLVEIDGCFAGT
jgi:hypothetical protein